MTNPPPRTPVRIALALGSNVGNRLETLQQAVSALREFITIDVISSVYKTAPAYVTDQPEFLNATLTGTTNLEPLALLWQVKEIEKRLGRTPTFRYGPRVLDIDILLYDDVIIKTPEMTVPHPRMQERLFVLQPLSDCAPSWQHPVLKKTVEELRALLPQDGVERTGDTLL